MTIGADDITRRAQQSISETWGTGTAYTRAYATGPGEVEALLAGDLALGSNMPTSWKDSSPGTAINSPKLQSLNRQHGKGVSGDVLVCTFIEMDISGSVSNGYAALTAVRKISEAQFEIIYEKWGLATAATSTGIPAIGAAATGTYTTVATPILFDNQINDSYHGRYVVRSLYRALKAGAVTANYKATTLVESK